MSKSSLRISKCGFVIMSILRHEKMRELKFSKSHFLEISSWRAIALVASSQVLNVNLPNLFLEDDKLRWVATFTQPLLVSMERRDPDLRRTLSSAQ
jgi:hypothetical protein